ncbi:MAG TPA: sulfite exporter TauE/SafE family protein [Candidatus Dormibacteraeota bacterium]|nr:sulfite exporter TauE/SafE family protein [Candidatus Dormibacteraeota bacterium]
MSAGSREPRASDRRLDLAIGGIGGLAGGLLGVGGGFVMVPLQVIWTGRSQHRATGTSLAAILPIALVAAAVYYFGRGTPQTDLTVAFYLAIGSGIGALLGSLAARRLSDTVLKVIVAILLVVVGLKEVYDAIGGAAPHLVGTTVRVLTAGDYALIAAGGVVVGVLSGLTGVGGGILIVPLLGLGFGIGQRIAQGTSLVAILPTAAIGALTHHRNGDVDVRAASWMAVAGVPAALIGSALALWLPQRALGGLFGIFLVVAATRIWPRRAERPPTPI